MIINSQTLKKFTSARCVNAQVAAVAEISEKVKTINDLTQYNSGVETEQMGTNKASAPMRASRALPSLRWEDR